MNEDLSTWTEERLRRKAAQAWDMAGLARQDRDSADEQRRTKEARSYEDELSSRRRPKPEHICDGIGINELGPCQACGGGYS